MATHSSILVWRIPWTEEPGRLPSIGLQSQTQLKQFSTHAGLVVFGATLMVGKWRSSRQWLCGPGQLHPGQLIGHFP